MKLFTLILLTLSLFACSPKSSPESTEKPQGVVTEAQQKTLNQAKEVEKTLQEENDKRLKEVDGVEDKKE